MELTVLIQANNKRPHLEHIVEYITSTPLFPRLGHQREEHAIAGPRPPQAGRGVIKEAALLHSGGSAAQLRASARPTGCKKGRHA